MADSPSFPDTGDGRGSSARARRWVKVAGIIGGVLLLLVVITVLAGHGPGRHISAGGTLSSSVTEDAPRGPARPKGGHE